MSDFLANLARRASGTLDVVRPRIPAVFEPHRRDTTGLNSPAGFNGWQSDSESPDTPLPENSSRSALFFKPEPSIATRVSEIESKLDLPLPPHLRNLLQRSRDLATHHPADEVRPGGESVGIAAPLLPGKQASSAGLSTQPAAVAGTAQPVGVMTHNNIPPHTPSALTAETPLSSRAVRPPVSLQSSSKKKAPAQPPLVREEPSVQVSIGRVEVRAIFPDPQPVRSPAPRAKTSVSLDEYLNRGKR